MISDYTLGLIKVFKRIYESEFVLKQKGLQYIMQS